MQKMHNIEEYYQRSFEYACRYFNPEQISYLKRIRIERLSSNEDNLHLVDGFYNTVNDSICDSIRNDAFALDQNNKVFYLVIKDDLNNIIFFFSLKIGQLFDNIHDDNHREFSYKVSELTERNKDNLELNYNNFKNIYCTTYGVDFYDYDNKYVSYISTITDALLERNANVIRVRNTLLAVEIKEFAANDNDNCTSIRSYFNTGDHFFGALIYWYYIVPWLLYLKDLIGIEFVYLFAASIRDENQVLVTYYCDRMGFSKDTYYGTIKPYRSWDCKFLYQRIEDIEEMWEDYFERYNAHERMV